MAAASAMAAARTWSGGPTAATAPRAKSAALARASSRPSTATASSQSSNARIEKSNRRSRFGEPMATMDCEDDDDLCNALSTDVQSLDVDDLDDVEEAADRKMCRKMKKGVVSSAMMFDLVTNPEDTAPVQSGAAREVKRLGGSGGRNSALVSTRVAGTVTKKSTSRERRISPSASKLSRNTEDPFLTRTAWEEHAYRIIRKQKLRDATLSVRSPNPSAQASVGLVETPGKNTLVRGGTLAAFQRETPHKREGAIIEEFDVAHMLKHLDLEDKYCSIVKYLHTLGLREREFIRIADRHKASLQANVTAVKERVEFLLHLGVQFRHLPKVIVRHPQILEYRVEQAVKPRVRYLKSLGLQDSEIGRIITVSPTLLECSLQRSIKPRVTYLVKTVGVSVQDIAKIVIRSPQLLTQSIEDALEPRVDFFLSEVKLSKEAFAKMVTRHPQLLHYSIEQGVRPRVKYLRSIGMKDDDVIKVLTRLTQILSLSVKNCLQPKYKYLVEELSGGVNTVISFPAYFSLSLDQRIVPRHRFLQVLQKSPQGPFPMRLLTISDEAFCLWAQSTAADFAKFRHDLLLSTFAKKFEWKNSARL